jgi:hypothetical protein
MPAPEALDDAEVPAGGKVRTKADWLVEKSSIVIDWAAP